MLHLTYELQRVDLPQYFNLEDMRVEAISRIAAKFDFLPATKVKWLQLGVIAARQWHQINRGLGTIWVHGEAGVTMGGERQLREGGQDI